MTTNPSADHPPGPFISHNRYSRPCSLALLSLLANIQFVGKSDLFQLSFPESWATPLVKMARDNWAHALRGEGDAPGLGSASYHAAQSALQARTHGDPFAREGKCVMPPKYKKEKYITGQLTSHCCQPGHAVTLWYRGECIEANRKHEERRRRRRLEHKEERSKREEEEEEDGAERREKQERGGGGMKQK